MLIEMQLAAVAATALLLAAFAVAHSRFPSDFSALWLAGWAAYGIRLVVDVLVTLTGRGYALAVTGHEATAVSAILLLMAVTRLPDQPALSVRRAALVLTAFTGWIVVSPLVVDGFALEHAPLFFAFGAIQLYTAYRFYKYLRQYEYASTPLIVASLTLWGFHKFDFPFLRPVEWFAPYGYALGAILAVSTGLGVVMFLVEDAERKAREQRARSERKSREYRDLFENLTDPVFIHDVEGRFMEVNDTAAGHLGYPKAELLSTTVGDIVAADQRDVIPERVTEIRETGSASFRSAHVTADGDRVPVDVHSSRIRYRGEQAILSVARDVSEQVAREEALQKFKQASEAAGHAIYITDPEGTIEYVNPAFESVTGYSREEAVGRNPRIMRSGEMPEGYFEELWATVLDGELWEEEVINRHKSGSIYHAHQTLAPITVDGEVEAVVAIQTDISDRKQQERRLQRYKQTIESSSNLLAAVDTDYEYLFANEAYREFHGVEPDTLPGTSVAEVLQESAFESVESALSRAMAGDSLSLERTRRSADGEERIFDVQYFPLEGPEGSIQGVGTAMRDVTEERERTEAIKQLSEYRRVMSAVNNSLVKAESTATLLPQVTEELSASSLFGCTFVALLDQGDDVDFVCSSESELTDADVADFHTDAYLEAVYDEGLVRIDDVTEPPFRQHVTEQPAHEGVGVAIAHEGERYGVLTVHFPPEEEVREVEYRLLRELAADLGLFLHSQTLEQDLRTFTEIAERIDDPIMLQDLEGRFEVVNPALGEYAGREPDSLLGADETAFMDEAAAERVQAMKRRTLETESPVRYEVTPTLPGKGERTFSTIRYPHYDEDGDLDGTVAICRDVTDLKERERHLQVIDRVLRHNVNNNMTVVEGFASTILERTADERIETYAGRIIDNSEDLVTTVKKERKISKVLSDRHPERRVDLVEHVESAVASVAEAHEHAEITTDLPASCEVSAVTAIEQAVEELVANAVIHTNADTPEVTVSVTAHREGCRVTVADTGPGIPEMERNVLTGEADIQPLYHGSGLGLWLVNLIVKEAGGYLEFDENDPQGSVVTITLSDPQ